MAASTPNPRSRPLPSGWAEALSADALQRRLEEEIGRAERHGTPLSCLLIVIDNLDELARDHGEELREEALGYGAEALQRELRRFDRIGRPSDRELAIILPGADGPRGEIVARRVLDRLRAIKVEAGGRRRALLVSVGLAAWQEGRQAEELLAGARAAARQGNGDSGEDGPGSSQPPSAAAPGTGGGAPEPPSPGVGHPARS